MVGFSRFSSPGAQFFDLANGEPLGALPSVTLAIDKAVFSPDGASCC